VLAGSIRLTYTSTLHARSTDTLPEELGVLATRSLGPEGIMTSPSTKPDLLDDLSWAELQNTA